MNKTPADMKNTYVEALNEALVEHKETGESLQFCCQAALESLNYDGVEIDALDLMRDQDESVVCVLVTGDVARITNGDIQWGRTAVDMN